MKLWIPLIILLVAAAVATSFMVVTKRGIVPAPSLPIVTQSPTPAVQKERVEVELSLVPEFSSLQVGAQGTIQVVIKTGDLGLSGVESSLTYDPQAVSVISVEPGPFLAAPTPLVETIDPAGGSIDYTLASLKYSQGEGTVFTIQVEALKPTTANPLKFNRQATKVGLRSETTDKRYGEDEVTVVFTEQPFSILP